MKTLFLDTHGEVITISFIDKDEVYTKEEFSEYSHSVHFLPLLDKMLKEKNTTLNTFDRVIVVNGPGSFTGIRIGLTVAKTIAFSLNIQIYVLSSLKAYILSNGNEDKNICIIEDPKGYYVFKDNEEYYTSDIENIDKDKIIENKLNPLKISEYFNDKIPENVHGIKANYVKDIEALK